MVNRQIATALKKEVKDKMPTGMIDELTPDMITDMIIDIVIERIDASVNKTLDSLVRDTFLQNLVQDKVFDGMQDFLEKEIKNRAGGLVSNTDLGTVVSDKITEFMRDRMAKADLPNGLIPFSAISTAGMSVPADKITPGIIRSFTSTGIEDTASNVQLTVMDGMIVVEGRTITNYLSVEQEARIRNLEVQDELRIKGTVVFENPSFSEQVKSLVETRMDDERVNRQIDLLGRPLISNGKEVLTESSLGPGIAISNLRKVGNLQDLNVIGRFTASGTIAAGDGRMGINTEDPTGVLTIWDEEAELTFKKHKNKTMYVGSTRDCDIVFGTNDKVNLALRKDGSASVNKLEIGQLKISSSNVVPEREGVPGEMVIMTEVKPGLPWAYQCMGGRSWTALKR